MLDNLIAEALEKIKKLESFEKVEFIILYGSSLKNQMREDSDIDLCIYFNANPEEAEGFRLKALSEVANDLFDIQIFNNLPLYVQIEVLGGKILYVKNLIFLYDIAYKTIREFEDFKPRFYDYIGEEALR